MSSNFVSNEMEKANLNPTMGFVSSISVQYIRVKKCLILVHLTENPE